MMRRKNVGDRFGITTVIALLPGDRARIRCDCGVEKDVFRSNLCAAKRSCGCLSARLIRQANTKHGHTRSTDHYRSPEYQSWDAMIGRCLRPNARSYAAYGARGITVCERWRTFENFLADMGPRPVGTTLDRIANAGNYEPGNCRWATTLEQGQNRKTTVFVEINGERRSIAQWARQVGISNTGFAYRMRLGLAPSELLKPSRRKEHRHHRNTLVDQLDGITR